MKCSRCGWHGDKGQPEVSLVGWPKDLPPPPPLPKFETHPNGKCPSRFAMDEQVFWAWKPDDSPALVEFLGITEFDGPEFDLVKGAWRLVSEAAPLTARVRVEGKLYVAPYDDLCSVEKWPMMV